MKTYRFVSSITKNFLENFLVYLQGSNFWLELKLYDPISLEVSSYGLKLETQPEAIDERKYTFQGMLKHLKHNDGRIVEVMGCLKFNESDGIDMLLTDISFSNNFLNFREVIENLSLSRTAFLVKAVEYYKEI